MQSEKIARCSFSQKASIFISVDEHFSSLIFSSYRAYWDWNGINKPLKVRWYYNFDVFYSQARRNRNKQNYLGMLFEIINHFDRIICLCSLILNSCTRMNVLNVYFSQTILMVHEIQEQKYLQMYKCTKWTGLADSVPIHGH